MTLRTGILDADASIKTVVDTIRKTISIEERWTGHYRVIGPDDKYVGEITVVKEFVSGKKNYGLDVRAVVIPVASKKEHASISRAINEHDWVLEKLKSMGYHLRDVPPR